MSLYSLLNDSRYVGCTDERQSCACFLKQEGNFMSLVCREESGLLYLAVKMDGSEVPAVSLPVPAYVKERIKFWNLWASEELLEMYDSSESPIYGLEAYAISIAVDISEAYPESLVDYAGFPVHDDWATLQYLLAHSKYGRNWDKNYPRVPVAWSFNRTMQRLVEQVTESPCYVPPHGYRMKADNDCGYCYYHFDPGGEIPRWGGYADSLDIDSEGGFPHWLVRRFSQLEEMDTWLWYEDYDLWPPSDYINPFLLDALSVDIVRYLDPPVPISASTRYVTGEVLLGLVQKLHAGELSL